ncbi:mycothiol system anti-sigma-R factor [Kineococcus sp. SYSU DK018]|uniref:mycothiol system anti-sigma-R factor n=1 Tax=Kineococcus sp. SYSU DK018 TaxID=3383139 RepID=UPI003D7C4961
MSGSREREGATAEGQLKQECREVLERAFEYLDGEMAELDCERLKAHLLECVSCVAQLAEDEQLKRAIREGCPCEAAPSQLRTRILVQITEVSASVR